MKNPQIKREWTRVRHQIGAVLAGLYDPILRMRYNRTAYDPQIIKGNHAVAPKIALYLIYQPETLEADIIPTCDFLTRAGYSVLIVANGGLNTTDYHRLAQHVWRILPRANFAQDWGGYRHGILHLLEAGLDITRLVVLNDSVVFPVCGGADFLHRAAGKDADITGGLLHHRHDDPFVESYFYSFSAKALAHPAFRQFWQTYPMSSNKYRLVRHGEWGFPKAMIRAGLSLDGLYSNDSFIKTLQGQSCDSVRLCLHYGVFRDSARGQACQDIVADYSDTADWHKTALDFIKQTLQKDGFNSTFCFGAVHLMGVPFLKKPRGAFHKKWVKTYRTAVIAGDLPQPPKAIMDMLEKGD